MMKVIISFDVLKSLGYQHENLDQCLLKSDRYSAFVELHIEQGKRLENDQKQLELSMVSLRQHAFQSP